MRTIVYLTYGLEKDSCESINNLMGKKVISANDGYTFSLTINDSHTSAKFEKFISRRFYLGEYEMRIVTNDEFIFLIDLCMQAGLFNLTIDEL